MGKQRPGRRAAKGRELARVEALLRQEKNSLVWSSSPPADKEMADGRRVVEPLVPYGVQRFISKRKKDVERSQREKEEALAKKKAERQEKHQALLQEHARIREERKARMADSNINKRFGAALTNKREALGLTQEQLAGVLGFDLNFLIEIETGARGVYFDTALRIVEVLQIRMEHFLELQDVEPLRRKLAAAIQAKEQEVEDEMMRLRRQMEELQTKQNMIKRLKNGGAATL